MKIYAYISVTIIALSLIGTVVHTFKQNGQLRAVSKQWQATASDLERLRQEEETGRQAANDALVAVDKIHKLERGKLQHEIDKLSEVDPEWRTAAMPDDTFARLLKYAATGPDYMQAPGRDPGDSAAADTGAQAITNGRLAVGNVELREALRSCNADKAAALSLYLGKSDK